MDQKPLHVGIILDGNRRYARKIGLPQLEGHRQGAETAKNLISEWASEAGITELTLYLFSLQNFNRTKMEVEFLMKLFAQFLKETLKGKEVDSKGICVRFLGRTYLLSKNLQTMMQELQERTKNNKRLIVNVALAYGGREEITDAVKKLIVEGVSSEQITEEKLSEYMWLQSEPHIIIRTSGEKRTSNFLVWQSTYSEWFFIDKLWPEFTQEDLQAVLKEYSTRERRFGK